LISIARTGADAIAAAGSLLVVAGHDVLAERSTERLEPIAKAPDDREVADHGVLLLHAIVNDQREYRDTCEHDRSYEHRDLPSSLSMQASRHRFVPAQWATRTDHDRATRAS
jgi:hypothetical protein